MKLAYLSNVFWKLNELTLQLQSREKHIPHLADKISAFAPKFEMWGRRLDEGISESEWVCWIQWFWIHIPCLKKHIFSLRGFFQKYFPSNGAHYDGVRYPFNAAAPTDFSSTEEDQFIKTTWLHTGWILAWCGEGAFTHRAKGYEDSASFGHILSLWDGFSAVASLKVSSLQPHFEKMCSANRLIAVSTAVMRLLAVLAKWIACFSGKVTESVLFCYRPIFIYHG